MIRVPRWPKSPGGPTQCSVSFVAAGAVSDTTSGTSLSPALPSGLRVNDICLCINYNGSSKAVSISSGWSQVFQTGEFTVWWRRMQSGDTAPTISGITVGNGDGAVIIAYRGCAISGSPIGATSGSFTQNSSSGHVVTCNGITTQNAYSKVLLLALAHYINVSSTTWSSLSVGTNTPVQEAWPYGAGAPFVAVLVADYAQATAGATGNASATSSNIPYNYLDAALIELITV